MHPVRSLLLRHRVLLMGLLFCALLVRALVPSGFMPVPLASGFTLTLCPDATPAAPPMAHAGMHHGDVEPDAPPKPEQPCGFAGLAAPALGSTDAVLLAGAIAFAVLLAVLGAALPLPAPPARLRPPLRAPPLPA